MAKHPQKVITTYSYGETLSWNRFFPLTTKRVPLTPNKKKFFDKCARSDLLME